MIRRRPHFLRVLSVLLACMILSTHASEDVSSGASLQRFRSFLGDYVHLPEDPHVGLFKKSGILSLAISGKKRNAFNAREVIEEENFTVKNLVVDFFGTPLEVGYAHLIRDPGRPTLIIHPGFMADLKSSAIGYLMHDYAERFPDTNLVFIEALSSRAFSVRNCFYALGGIHEPYAIHGILRDYWNTNGIRNRESILLGSSSSSFSVLATPIVINRKERDRPLKGSLLSAGYRSMRPVYDWFDSVSKDEHLPDRHRLVRQLGFDRMNKKFVGIAPSKEEIECRTVSRSSNSEGFSGLLRSTFDVYRTSLISAWKDLYGANATLPDTYASMLDELSLDRLVTKVDTPFFWLQSKNDPLPVDEQFDQFFENTSPSHPWIAGDQKKYGSHGAFEVVYGKDWFFSRIDLFKNHLFTPSSNSETN